MTDRLLVATNNLGKAREFRALLAPLRVQLVFPHETGLVVDVVEDGSTYADNAAKKAQAFARATALPCLADDSGLEVDALGGAPGVRSARYSPGRDEDRIAALLRALEEIPWEDRTARFRCVVAFEAPDQGMRLTAQGICEGIIALSPTGGGGFGYDPIFYIPEQKRTMAQLSQTMKNRISHRARAVRGMLPAIERYFAARQSEG
jgi:XTP/dITP diphosphohydrolase